MRPVPSRLPLLWLASLAAMVVAVHLGWRLVLQPTDVAQEAGLLLITIGAVVSFNCTVKPLTTLCTSVPV